MQGFLRFLTYNNAVPIALAILVLGAGSTFAAVDPDAIYSSDQQVVSVDNSYIVNKDLASYSPQARIISVTEDTDNYYIAYQFYTIDLENGAWRDVVKDKTMSVSKGFLGAYRDLGLYVTEQLKQNVDAELARLQATQDIEKKNVTQKVVATTYGGLIGKMLDTTTETLPGYVPVVAPPPPANDSQTASAGASSGSASAPQASAAQIGLQLLGNNPAVIPLRTSYSDLGAVLIDPLHQNVGIHVFQNGVEVSAPTVDTSTTSVAAIEYRATDHNGTTVVVRRIVLIGGAADPGGEVTSAGNTEPSVPVSAPASTPQQQTPSATTSAQEQAPEQTPDTDIADQSSASSTSTAASSTSETADGTAAASTQATSTPADDDVGAQTPEAATSSSPESASSTPAL
jgi:hypothetical protein